MRKRSYYNIVPNLGVSNEMRNFKMHAETNDMYFAVWFKNKNLD